MDPAPFTQGSTSGLQWLSGFKINFPKPKTVFKIDFPKPKTMFKMNFPKPKTVFWILNGIRLRGFRASGLSVQGRLWGFGVEGSGPEFGGFLRRKA